LGVDKDVSFLPCLVCPHRTRADQRWASLSSALDALVVDDASSGAGLSFGFLAAFEIRRMMNSVQRAVAIPLREIVIVAQSGAEDERCVGSKKLATA
jgi:hypothetical protein